MSSRDIDSTSENVLHDWAREEAAVDEPEEPAVDGSEPDSADEAPAWGTASTTAEPLEPAPAEVIEAEKDSVGEVAEVEEAAADDELEPDTGDVEIDETPMQVELSHEHAGVMPISPTVFSSPSSDATARAYSCQRASAMFRRGGLR